MYPTNVHLNEVRLGARAVAFVWPFDKLLALLLFAFFILQKQKQLITNFSLICVHRICMHFALLSVHLNYSWKCCEMDFTLISLYSSIHAHCTAQTIVSKCNQFTHFHFYFFFCFLSVSVDLWPTTTPISNCPYIEFSDSVAFFFFCKFIYRQNIANRCTWCVCVWQSHTLCVHVVLSYLTLLSTYMCQNQFELYHLRLHLLNVKFN